jgi:2-haloacid dehalogenase
MRAPHAVPRRAGDAYFANLRRSNCSFSPEKRSEVICFSIALVDCPERVLHSAPSRPHVYGAFMSIDRRNFVKLALASILTPTFLLSSGVQSATKTRFSAVVFDAFPVFDPRPIFSLAERLFPGKGAELSNVWRTRQFEYQWLSALSENYLDFWAATENSLVFAAEMLHLELTDEKCAQLMHAYLTMKAWPDVPQALDTLNQSGIRLALLSNMTSKMLAANLESAGLDQTFEAVLSTDAVQAYKPAPRAYMMAVDALGLKREEILFAPFAGWDAAGAKWFGYPTFWVNRLDLPVERLGVTPDAAGRDLSDLVRFAAWSGTE